MNTTNYLFKLVLIGTLLPLYISAAPSTNLGGGEPGLKIIYKTTNQFVIYVDEPWTVGPGLIGGYYDRHIDVLYDLNYGLKGKIQTHTWTDTPQQVYAFDDRRGFTCDVSPSSADSESWTNLWPHQNMVVSLVRGSVAISDEVYTLARGQYSLTTNQYFLGKIGPNVFYWEMGDPRKAYYRPVGEKKATNYFTLPKGMIDLFGVTKGVKKDVGFVVFKKSTGFFRYSPQEFVFLEFSFKDAKRTISIK